MKWLSFTLAVLVALSANPALSQSTKERVPVALKLVGDDALSMQLRQQLEKALYDDNRVRLATAADARTVVIQTDGNVDVDVLDGRKVAIIIAYVFDSDGKRYSPVVRACWTNQVSICASQLVRVARIRALDMRLKHQKSK